MLMLMLPALVSCQNRSAEPVNPAGKFRSGQMQPVELSFPEGSWEHYLQHLPVADAPIVDYRGRPIANQAKHAQVITYDVGTSDLQQCADALMRLRAEYLFSQKKYGDIGFHFTGGGYYAWAAYCRGIRPVNSGGHVTFAPSAPPAPMTHAALRKYLDIVYNYANTVSLCKELKPAKRFQIGTVIIFPGNPGHCCMIIDAAVINKKDTMFKLAEGYMPAQSIYVLSNPYEPQLSPWYHLHGGTITTASCEFRSYFLRKFE